jgi:hypothetical protein
LAYEIPGSLLRAASADGARDESDVSDCRCSRDEADAWT